LVSLDPEKLLFIFVIAVLVLGPERLPQAARTLGRGLAEIRKYTSGFQSEVKQVLAEPRAIIDAAVREADLRPDLRSDRPRSYNGDTPTERQAPAAGSASAAGVDGTATVASNGGGSNGGGSNGGGSNGGGSNGGPVEQHYPGPFAGDGNGSGPVRADRGPADLRTAAPGAPDDPALN
jgi:sec-independent protein translocase protein TatB